MFCQCCGTKDNKHYRGPVRSIQMIGEGLCKVCFDWVGRIITAELVKIGNSGSISGLRDKPC